MINSNTFLNEEDLKKILEAPVRSHPSQQFKMNTLVILLWESGMRIGEVCNIQIEDFDQRERFITLKKTKNKTHRIIPVTRSTAARLVKLIGKSKSGYIFKGRGDNPLSRITAYQAIQRRVAASKIGKRITPHSFRHAFITRMIDSGQPLPRIQRFVGHSSLAVTGMYYNFSKEDLRLLLQE